MLSNFLVVSVAWAAVETKQSLAIIPPWAMEA
jgi:hypothetical protein